MLNLGNSFLESEKFLLGLEVGEGWDHVRVVRRTDKRIWLSNGSIVHLKRHKSMDFHYLDGKGNSLKQVLRDIEGHLVAQIHFCGLPSY